MTNLISIQVIIVLQSIGIPLISLLDSFSCFILFRVENSGFSFRLLVLFHFLPFLTTRCLKVDRDVSERYSDSYLIPYTLPIF